ncbi:MAG: hypothetical protein ACRKGH_05600 [Dehalogenimonas sp.]
MTVAEIEKHEDPRVRRSFHVKLGNYNILKTQAPMADAVTAICESMDEDENDHNDTLLVNELFAGRVDALITEDKKIIQKAALLGLSDKVFSIDAFLEKVTAENPDLADYKVLAVKKELFGHLDINDEFFNSFREDYPGFEAWFNRKADETVYVCSANNHPVAVLYVKPEGKGEDYSDISPPFAKTKRLKISTFKVALNGFRLGERFLKIVFDNALRFKVDEIYVTIYDKSLEQQRLINLLEEFGFHFHGYKSSPGGPESVYVRSFARTADRVHPRSTYPFFSTAGRCFIVPIYPEYHTDLFPDSILRTESPDDFVENAPHRNAIKKVYISRSIERNLNSGDILIFYRTGGVYQGVVTTIGIVEKAIDGITAESDFIRLCRKRSVFSDQELSQQWNFKPRSHPFIVNFLYACSFPKRMIMKRLIEIGVIADAMSAPRGFTQISIENLKDIMKECQVDESLIVD